MTDFDHQEAMDDSETRQEIIRFAGALGVEGLAKFAKLLGVTDESLVLRIETFVREGSEISGCDFVPRDGDYEEMEHRLEFWRAFMESKQKT